MTASATKESVNERCALSPKFLPGDSYAGMLLLAANIAYWMLAGAYTPFLSAYFTAIGLSATQTGVLLTIQPLAVIFIQPLWARLSDRTGKRKLVLSFLVAASAVSVLLYYLGIRFATVLFATVVFSLFFSALLPLCDALVIDGCSTHGVEFARVRMGGDVRVRVCRIRCGIVSRRQSECAVRACRRPLRNISNHGLPASRSKVF